MIKIGSGVFTGYAFKESDTYIHTYIHILIKKTKEFKQKWFERAKSNLENSKDLFV